MPKLEWVKYLWSGSEIRELLVETKRVRAQLASTQAMLTHFEDRVQRVANSLETQATLGGVTDEI